MPLVLFDEFVGLTKALDSHGVDYALVGALAVAVWGAPRATTDIDLIVEREDLDRVLELVASLGFDAPAMPMRFSDGMELRRVCKLEGPDVLTLDLMLVDDNLRPAWDSRQRLETDHGPLWVVSREALIAMKVAANRLQDLLDVQRLRDVDR